MLDLRDLSFWDHFSRYINNLDDRGERGLVRKKDQKFRTCCVDADSKKLVVYLLFQFKRLAQALVSHQRSSVLVAEAKYP